MVKIRLVLRTVLLLFITIFTVDNTVTAQNVIRTIDLNPGSNIPVTPVAIGVNHVNNNLYVTTINTIKKLKYEILVIEGLSDSVSKTIELPGGLNFRSQIEVNPLTKRIYIAKLDGDHSDKIYVINGTTNAIITTITIEGGISGISINKTTNRIYVVNNRSVSVTVIDGRTNKIIDVIKLQDDIDFFFNSGGIKVNHSTNRIYVFKNSVDKSASVVSHDVLILSTERPNSENAENIDNDKKCEIFVIDGTTNKIIESVTLNFETITAFIDQDVINSSSYSGLYGPSGPSIRANDIIINNVTNRVYINTTITSIHAMHFNVILVMDGLTCNIIDTIDIGGFQGYSEGIAVNSRTNRIYSTDLNKLAVKVIDGRTNQVISIIKAGNEPYAIKTDPSHNLVYVADVDSGSIRVINDEGQNLQQPTLTLTVTHDSTASKSSFRNATLTLLDQNGNPLCGMTVKASTNGISATVSPHIMFTNHEGRAQFKFNFLSTVTKNKNKKITFTANKLETSITNED